MKDLYKVVISGGLMFAGFTLSAQNGTKLLGTDAATIGRGGTSTGTFDNPSLISNNPAGLSFLEAPQLDISATIMTPKLSFKNDINDATGKNKIFPAGSIGFAKKIDDELAFGIGIYTQGGLGAEYSLNHILFKDPQGNYIPQKYNSQFAVLQAGASLSYKVAPKFSIGVTANLIYSQFSFGEPFSVSPSLLKGVIDRSKGITFGNLFSGPPEQGGLGYKELVANAEIKDLTAIEFNGKLGLAYKPLDNLSIGVSYTLPTKLQYKGGKATLDMNAQLNDAFGRIVQGILTQNPTLTQQEAQQQAATQFSQLGVDLSKGASDEYDAKATLFLPQSIAFGISYGIIPKLRLSADVEWVNWANAFKNLEIKLSEGTNPNVNRLLGSNGKLDIPFPLQWKNSVLVKTGVEYDVIKALTIRAGYVYGNNPVPSSTLFPVFPAVAEHHFTIGTGINISQKIALNLAYEHAFKKTVQSSTESLVGSQYNNSFSSLQNQLFHASLSWKFK